MDDNSNNRESAKSTEVQWIQACQIFVSKWALALCLYSMYSMFCDVVNRSPTHLWRRQRRVIHRRAVLHTPGRKKVCKPPVREVKLSSGNLLIIFHHCPSRTELSEHKKDVCAICNVPFTSLKTSFYNPNQWESFYIWRCFNRKSVCVLCQVANGQITWLSKIACSVHYIGQVL